MECKLIWWDCLLGAHWLGRKRVTKRTIGYVFFLIQITCVGVDHMICSRIVKNRYSQLCDIPNCGLLSYLAGCMVRDFQGPLILPSIPSGISNHIQFKLLVEVTYPFPNFHGAAIDVCEWKINFFSRFIMRCNYLPMLGSKVIHAKEASDK